MSELSQKIQIEVNTTESIYLDGTPITEIVSELETINTNLTEQGYTNLRTVFVRNCGCRYDCSCHPSVVIYGKRLETDKEYEKRVNELHSRQAAIEKYERDQLTKLMKKYKV